MTEPSLEERLRATFERAADAPLVAASPVAVVVAAAHRRQRRARTARTALVVAVVLALLGALTVERRNRVGTEPDVDQILKNSNTYLPTWLPDDLLLDSVSLNGPVEPTYDPTERTVVLSDPSGRRQFELTVERPQPLTALAVENRRHLPTMTIGQTSASVWAFSPTTFLVQWMLDGRPTTLVAVGTTIPVGVELASSVRLAADGSVTLAPPAGTVVAYDGPRRTAAPTSWISWAEPPIRNVTLTVTADRAPFVRPWQPTDEPVQLPLGPAWIRDDDSGQRSVFWLDDAGRQHELSTYGIGSADTLRIARSLVVAGRGRWADLTADARPGVVTILMPGDPGFESTEASTAPTTAPPPVPLDAGAADAVPPGGWLDAKVRHERVGVGSVVRLDEDRWIGVARSARPGVPCDVEPVTDGTRLAGWQAPCDDTLRWAPDGRCASSTCAVGLTTFAVRVEGGRVLADPSDWHWGDAGPALTGESP